MPILLIILIWAGIGGVALAVWLWLRENSRQEVVERAISGQGVGGSQAPPLRILRPTTGIAGGSFTEKVLRRAPSVWSENASIQQQLVQAGYDNQSAPAIYAIARVASVVALPLLLLLVFAGSTLLQTFVIGVAAALIGLILPVGYVVRAVRVRQDKIRRSLPDALDLLVVCVEAGISLDAAVLRVAREMVYVHPELSRELLIVNRKTNAGVTREQALRGLWDRTGVEELRTLVSSLIQSEKWGTSSARVLRISAETLRRKRRQTAERKAATAPIKMLIPMALLIFPALFVVILGPAVQKIFEAFSGK
jgi:tight adherence protein C